MVGRNATPKEFAEATQAHFAARKAAATGVHQTSINRQKFADAVEKAQARHPEIAPEIFHDIRHAYGKKSGSNLQGDYDRIYHETLKKYPEQGEQALQALGYELHGEGMLTKGIKMFYNSDKGGLQIGGIIGALLGFKAFMSMTAGGAGGWVGLVGLAFGIGLGAYGGNLLVDTVKNAVRPKAPPAGDKAPAAERTAPVRPKEPYYDAPSEGLSLRDTGTLPTPSVPKAPPRPQGQQPHINQR